MERDPIKNDVRAEQRARRLGPGTVCIVCGVATPEALTRVNKTLLERHHVAVRAHDGALTVPICLNCHRTLTEGQLHAGVSFLPQGIALERLVAILSTLSVFLYQLGESVERWAGVVRQVIAGLDSEYPEWRGKAWARV